MLPEALEGNNITGSRKADGGFESLSHHLVLLPEALEGNNI